MSLSIKNVCIHSWAIQSGNITINLSDKLAGKDTGTTTDFITNLFASYEKRSGKSYGKFEEDADVYPMSKYIEDWRVTANIDFLESTKKMMKNLKPAKTATGAYMVFSEIEVNSISYLLIAVVNHSSGASIKDDDFEKTLYLDIKNMRFAGRVNLTEWENKADGYISFLNAGTNVSDYFQMFLGCNSSVASKQVTFNLTGLIDNFISQKKFTPEQAHNFYQKSHEHLATLVANKQPFNAETFCNELSPASPDELLSFINSEEYKIPDGFIPDHSIVKSLTVLTAKTTKWELKIQRSAINDKSITYDKDNDIILLKNPPQSLKEQLITTQNDNSETKG